MRMLSGALAAMLLAGSTFASGSVGESAADFTRKDLAGKEVHLADYRGKVVLLNFWATWCGPCLAEIPAFSHWQQQHGASGLQIIGISMDDEEQSARRFVQKTPPAYPVVMGDTTLAKLYGGIFGLPLTFLIDANGKIAARYLGDAKLPAMEAKINRLLKQ